MQQPRRNTLIKYLTMIPVMGLLLAACGQGASNGANGDAADGAPTVTLTTVSPFPEGDEVMETYFMAIERLEEEVDGLSIDYRGGPEAVDPFELGEAVADGAVDFSALPANYYESILPWAVGMSLLAPLTPTELEESGIWEFMREKYAEAGLYLSVDTTPLVPYQLYLNEPITSAADLDGMTIRVSPQYVSMMDALGVESVLTPGGEIYTAMERGVVEGFAWTSLGITALGLQEVTKYEILPSFYQSAQALIFNDDVWNGIPQGMQEEIMTTLESMDEEFINWHVEEIDRERAERIEAGMEVIELGDAEGQEFLDIITTAKWDEVIETYPEIEELRALYETAMADRS